MRAVITEIVHEPPSAEAWTRLTRWFQNPQVVAEDLDETLAALESWPDAVRVAPRPWVYRAAGGRPTPALRLARALVLDGFEAEALEGLACNAADVLDVRVMTWFAPEVPHAEAAVVALLQSSLCAELRALAFDVNRVTAPVFRALADAPCMRSGLLESLRITGCALEDVEARMVLCTHPQRALHTLELPGHRLTDQLARLIATPGVLPALRRLDLSDNLLTDTAATLLAGSAHLEGLERLDLQKNPMTDAGSDALFSSWHLGEAQILFAPVEKETPGDVFGEVRSALHGSPSDEGWRLLCDALDRAPRATLEHQLLPYVEHTLQRWPDALREAPTAWVNLAAREHMHHPALRLCAAFRLRWSQLVQLTEHGAAMLRAARIVTLYDIPFELSDGLDHRMYRSDHESQRALECRLSTLIDCDYLHTLHVDNITGTAFLSCTDALPDALRVLDLSGGGILWARDALGYFLTTAHRRWVERSGAPFTLRIHDDRAPTTEHILQHLAQRASTLGITLDVARAHVVSEEEYEYEYNERMGYVYDEYDDEWE